MTPADQLSINFTAPYARGSATSRAAAKAIEPVAGTQRALILNEILLCEDFGCTDAHLQRVLVLSGDTVRPRRGELLKAGLIVGSGRTRKTSSGRAATVWVATEFQT